MCSKPVFNSKTVYSLVGQVSYIKRVKDENEY
jgi:hypothetical protein